MKYRLFLVILLSLPGTLFARQTHFLSLEELFRLGRENSLRLHASRIEESIAGEKVKDLLTGRLPDIQLGATAGYLGQPVVFSRGLTGPVHPGSPDWKQNYNLNIFQPIYQGGKIRYTIERASLEKQLALLSTADNEAEIKITLLRQYLNLFSLHKQQELFARNIAESERRLEDIKRMKKEGIVTLNDEIRSELELTNYRLAYREAGDNIAIVSQQLDILLGLDESLLLQPDTALLNTVHSLGSYDTCLEEAYANYPGLNIARQNTVLAKNNIRLAKAAYLPSLSVQGSNTLARPLSTTMEDLFSNNWNIVLSLSFNLSSLYQNRHKVEQARQNVRLEENREQQILQDLRIQVRSAYIRHQEASDRTGSLMLAVRQADENYRIVRNRYMNQLSILTDLLDAENIRLQAELQLTTARAEMIYTYYELLRACGNL